MLVAIIVLAVSQTLFTVAMGLTVGPAGRATAYPQLLAAQQALGHAGLLVMLGVTALTAVNTFNGGFVTMSRFMYAVAREGKLPRALTRLNDRAVPVVPVWILGLSSLAASLIVVAVTGTWVMVVSVCAALEMMIYAAAGFVVWRLRQRQADAERPFRLGGRPGVRAGRHDRLRPARAGQRGHRRQAHQRRAARVPRRGRRARDGLRVHLPAPAGAARGRRARRPPGGQGRDAGGSARRAAVRRGLTPHPVPGQGLRATPPCADTVSAAA